MTDRMFFCYEKNFACRWVPVVYWDEKPTKKMEGNIERSSIYEVPEDCIVNGEPAFGKLRERFAPPQDKIDDEAS